MGHKEKLDGDGEWDAFSSWRKVYCYLKKPGVVRKIKRRFNKRIRKEEKQKLRDILLDKQP